MNKTVYIFVFFVTLLSNLIAQTRITGVVKDAFTKKEIYNVTVRLVDFGESVQTDRIGYFQISAIPEGFYTLEVSSVGYETYQSEIIIKQEERIDLGDILITFNPNKVEAGVVILSTDELSSSQSFSGVLQSSPDIFSKVSAYQLGAYRFKPRGYETKDYALRFNGIRMNKIDNGRADFMDWGGLNDITRYPAESIIGINPAESTFGNLAGVTNYEPRSSSLRKGISFSYSLTDRTSYRQRLMLTYNSGLSKKGWGYTASMSRRWADEGVINGTLYDAWAYYLGVEKKLNNAHSLNFSFFGAPHRYSMASANTEEIVDLKGRNYNAYWGWQNGSKRNERVRKKHQPISMLSHYWKIDAKTKLTTTFAYQFGEEEKSRLSWYNAMNPSPTYYKNLPSSYRSKGADQETIDEVIAAWENDPSYYQLNWAGLYAANANRADGSAAYMLVADKKKQSIGSFNAHLKKQLNDNIEIITAISYQYNKTDYYQEILDLLGAKYALNHDFYAESGSSGNYNLQDKEIKKVKEGERMVYNYSIKSHYADFFAQSKISWDKLDWTLGVMLSMTSYLRDGKFQHYLYTDRSLGKSKTQSFYNVGLKTQFLYKLDGRNYIQWNGQYSTLAPTLEEVFPNARSNDFSVPGLTNEEIYSIDLNYIYRAPTAKARVSFFYTVKKDAMEKSFGYIDARGIDSGGGSYFGSEVMVGIDKEYIGGELAFEKQITSTINLYSVVSLGQYTYANNPEVYLFYDDVTSNLGYKSYGQAYINKYHLATGPQHGASLGIEYRDPKYWWVGLSGNYLGQNYLDIAAFRRTKSFITDSDGQVYTDLNEEEVKNFLKQSKMSNEFMLNLNLGKTFRFGIYAMGVSMTVNNLLNNKNYVTGGFEQLRIGDYKKAEKENYKEIFGPKLWYSQGRSFFANVYFRF